MSEKLRELLRAFEEMRKARVRRRVRGLGAVPMPAPPASHARRLGTAGVAAANFTEAGAPGHGPRRGVSGLRRRHASDGVPGERAVTFAILRQEFCSAMDAHFRSVSWRYPGNFLAPCTRRVLGLNSSSSIRIPPPEPF